MNTRCHLSGLPINENDPIIALPVALSTPKYAAQCYQSDRDAMLHGYPILGTYTDYGLFTPSDEDGAFPLFLKSMQSNLLVNSRWFKETAQFDFSDRMLYLLERGEFSSDVQIIEANKAAVPGKLNPDSLKSPLLNTTNSLTPEALIKGLQHGHFVRVQNNFVVRYNYVLIKRDVFDEMVSKLYPSTTADYTVNIQNLYADAMSMDSEPRFFRGMEEQSLRDAIGICNGDFITDDIRQTYLKIISTSERAGDDAVVIRACGSALSQLTPAVVRYGQIHVIYNDLGLTFYPQVSIANEKMQYRATRIIAQMQEALRLKRHENNEDD
jgi:hypothetical protein